MRRMKFWRLRLTLPKKLLIGNFGNNELMGQRGVTRQESPSARDAFLCTMFVAELVGDYDLLKVTVP